MRIYACHVHNFSYRDFGCLYDLKVCMCGTRTDTGHVDPARLALVLANADADADENDGIFVSLASHRLWSRVGGIPGCRAAHVCPGLRVGPQQCREEYIFTASAFRCDLILHSYHSLYVSISVIKAHKMELKTGVPQIDNLVASGMPSLTVTGVTLGVVAASLVYFLYQFLNHASPFPEIDAVNPLAGLDLKNGRAPSSYKWTTYLQQASNKVSGLR